MNLIIIKIQEIQDWHTKGGNIMSKNLGSIVLTEENLKYYEQNNEKSQDFR